MQISSLSTVLALAGSTLATAAARQAASSSAPASPPTSSATPPGTIDVKKPARNEAFKVGSASKVQWDTTMSVDNYTLSLAGGSSPGTLIDCGFIDRKYTDRPTDYNYSIPMLYSFSRPLSCWFSSKIVEADL